MRRASIAVMAAIAVGASLSSWLANDVEASPGHAVTAIRARAVAPTIKPDHAKYQWAAARRLAPLNTLSSGSYEWQTVKVKSGDSLSELFSRAGLPATDWTALLQLQGKVGTLRSLHPGNVLHYKKSPDGHLAALKYALGPLNTLHVKRVDDHFTASVTHKAETVRVVRAAGQIHSALLTAVEHTGVNPTTAANFAHILHWRIDLSRAIHGGDHFTIIYQQVYVHHKLVKTGPVLAARLTTDNRSITAFRYTNQQGHTAYYDTTGKSLRPSILRTPVNYTRVSSPFSVHRFNPVLHVWRPHYGVDLAAPMGTPIKAAANGYVKFIGHDGGYGRLVMLNNFGPYSTRYGHMARFAKGLQQGDFVHQGQTIGYVGQSGVATGPHLHFEIRINGTPKPPLKVDLPDGAPIADDMRTAYRKAIKPFLAALNNAPQSGQVLLAERQVPHPGDTDKLTVASISTCCRLMPGRGHFK